MVSMKTVKVYALQFALVESTITLVVWLNAPQDSVPMDSTDALQLRPLSARNLFSKKELPVYKFVPLVTLPTIRPEYAKLVRTTAKFVLQLLLAVNAKMVMLSTAKMLAPRSLTATTDSCIMIPV